MNKTESELKQPAPLPLHPITGEYADFTSAELVVLRDDIRLNGQRVPAIIWRGQTVDGRHRAMVCAELGIPLKTEDITDQCPTAEAMRAYVASLNQHRRSRTTPLTNEEKRARVEAALKADPARSDVAIAEEIGVTQPFVSGIRKDLEAKGVITVITQDKRKSRTGRTGQGARRTTGRRARKPAPSKTQNPSEPQHAPAPAPQQPQTPETPEPQHAAAPAPELPPEQQQAADASHADLAKPEAPSAGAPAAEVPSGQEDQDSEDREDTEWGFEQHKALNEQLDRVGFQRILSSMSLQILSQFARHDFADVLDFSDKTERSIYFTRLLKTVLADPDEQKRQQALKQLREMLSPGRSCRRDPQAWQAGQAAADRIVQPASGRRAAQLSKPDRCGDSERLAARPGDVRARVAQ
jgi:hypothetical protein